LVGANGALTPHVPPSVSAGTFPARILVDPRGKHLYVKNSNDGTMSQYVINDDGTLSANGLPVSGLGFGGYAAIAPNGRFVFVTTYTPTIYQLVVDTDGRLIFNTPSSIAATGNTTGMTLTPDGAYAYACSFSSNVVNQYSVGESGTLTPRTPATVPTGGNPRQIAVTPNGSYAYVTNADDSMISLYRISDGKLTPTQTVATGTQPNGIVLTRNGRHLYVANAGDRTISQFSVRADGTLAPNTPPAVAVEGSPFNMVTDANDEHLYVTNWTGNAVLQMAIAEDGTLQPIPDVPAAVPSGGLTWDVAIVSK